jgi:uncharacterized BrkB/YihY/UPF0761 family membrane protein
MMMDEFPTHWAKRLKLVLIQSLTSWIDHRAASKGAALAFYTLFSMTPILILAIAAAGHIFGADAAQGEIVGQMRELVEPNGAQAIQAMLVAAQDATSGLVATIVASALLLWVYYSAQIFFFGAEFTRQYALCFGSLRPECRTDQPD